MALEKQITYDHQVSEDGTVFARRITRIVEDGKEIAKSHHRFTVLPGMSAEDAGLDVEDERGRSLINTLHTPDVVDKFKKKKKEK